MPLIFSPHCSHSHSTERCTDWKMCYVHATNVRDHTVKLVVSTYSCEGLSLPGVVFSLIYTFRSAFLTLAWHCRPICFWTRIHHWLTCTLHRIQTFMSSGKGLLIVPWLKTKQGETAFSFLQPPHVEQASWILEVDLNCQFIQDLKHYCVMWLWKTFTTYLQSVTIYLLTFAFQKIF